MNSESIVELLPPKVSVADRGTAMERFARRYRAIIDAGLAVSIEDNPLGDIRFQGADLIEELDLATPSGRVILHLNTFHANEEFDALLDKAAALGIESLFLTSGDGDMGPTRLAPGTMGLSGEVVTAAGLVAYVRARHGGQFQCGVAFNPYAPTDAEREKLSRKKDAGADFVITQPILGEHVGLRPLDNLSVPVFLGAWMSDRVTMLPECVGYQVALPDRYDPLVNARGLRTRYPNWGLWFCAVKPEKLLAGTAVL